jgi:hypothetical protein
MWVILSLGDSQRAGIFRLRPACLLLCCWYYEQNG